MVITGRSRKPLFPNGTRGFESHLLRMKKLIILILIPAIALIGLFSIKSNRLEFSHALTIKNRTIYVAITKTAKEQAQGLSGLDSIQDNQGMLFVHADEKPRIWMKDMRFPIDIIWIDKNNKIVDLIENVSPATYPKTFSSKVSARYTLEVNTGFVQKNKIKIGEMVKGEVGP